MDIEQLSNEPHCIYELSDNETQDTGLNLTEPDTIDLGNGRPTLTYGQALLLRESWEFLMPHMEYIGFNLFLRYIVQLKKLLK